MKKWVQNFCSFLLSAGLLCGCSVNANVPESTPVQHIVTQVDITSHHAGTVTKHSYRDPETMEQILNSLRLLQLQIIPEYAPSVLPVDFYEIAVHTGTGDILTYRQWDQEYISYNRRPWEKVDPESAENLYLFLESIPDGVSR